MKSLRGPERLESLPIDRDNSVWGAGNVLLVLFSWKVNIVKKNHCWNGVVDTFGLCLLYLKGQTVPGYPVKAGRCKMLNQFLRIQEVCKAKEAQEVIWTKIIRFEKKWIENDIQITSQTIATSHILKNPLRQYPNLSTTHTQWGASNVYLLDLSSWKVNIAENPIAVMGL